ncbi:hypothetical protein [Dysosmobacter acutus]|nr:hypothetical protein [Dysosmobacter acutus]
MKKSGKRIEIARGVRELLVLAALMAGAVLLRWAVFMPTSL